MDKQLHVNIQSCSLAKKKNAALYLQIGKSQVRLMRLMHPNTTEPLPLENCAVPEPRVQEHKWVKKKPKSTMRPVFSWPK